MSGSSGRLRYRGLKGAGGKGELFERGDKGTCLVVAGVGRWMESVRGEVLVAMGWRMGGLYHMYAPFVSEPAYVRGDWIPVVVYIGCV